MSHLYGDILKFLPTLQSKIDETSSYWSNLWMENKPKFHYKEMISNKRGYTIAELSSSSIFQKPIPLSFSSGTWFKQEAYNKWVNLQIRFGKNLSKEQRKRIVVVGTGWASIAFLSHIDITKYDVKIVSPRNYFAFTPLLPSACNGTLSPEACMVPMKYFTQRGSKTVMEYLEARAAFLDLEDSKIQCEEKDGRKFDVPYDYLLLAVGAEVNTFGIPGVREHALFLKEVEHAREIRNKMLFNLERANTPGVSESEKRRLLHFVVIGGGPTGVEVAAELADFLREDCKKAFPDLLPYVKVTIIEMLPHLLPTFSEKASKFSFENLSSIGVDVMLQTQVTRIDEQQLTVLKKGSCAVNTVQNKEGGQLESSEVTLPYGMVVWASGVAQTPFAKSLLSSIPEQKGNRVIRVDHHLLTHGAKNVYTLGDCAFLTPPKIENLADVLFAEATHHPSKAGSDFLSEKAMKGLHLEFPQLKENKWHFKKKPRRNNMTLDEFKAYLKEIDNSYVSPAPTAQNAKKQGTYLATVFNSYLSDTEKLHAPIYEETWDGSMAYVGKDRAILDLPFTSVCGGFYSGFLWKLVYWKLVYSMEAKLRCLQDWFKSRFSGRNLGRESSTN
ncbi:naDH dehydrogenase (NDH2-II) [Cardiosporidium cionae]|uniref:NADH:ubiquinone reductase (non-electrogenic) n=1 Tax=Cardiosporidium cionae TaxID=476202 RepID=A0ABQ7J7Q2_9APIC|nr:naDH dehydrogenase (NDH2-II) [Cardiosporidium cionae]|eukprot:KAF8820016.1 naDH dehydrogenase (NDH2-II) [Cardiosporidium cionae]